MVYGTVYNFFLSVYTLWAADGASGTIIWTQTLASTFFYIQPPAYNNGMVLAYSAGNTLAAMGLLATSGTIIWTTPFSAATTTITYPYSYTLPQVR